MPTIKEINNILFDQLALLDRIEERAMIDHAENTLEQIKKERKWIQQKLYQNPELTEDLKDK